jgi:hypothetical protein
VQFKGSVRAPGDKEPGISVVLEIDEYHLEIRRDSDLIGRYYLADVEVARDIAERFILFLGDDEVEFLADDALQFAYEGVTAMQDGWLAAQKKRRRNRRAADDSARRKDGEPPLEVEATFTRPLQVSDSDPIRTRRRQTGNRPPQPAAPEPPSPTVKPAPVTETRKQRKESVPTKTPSQAEPAAPSKVASSKRDSAKPIPVAKTTEGAKPSAPRKSAAATTGRTPKGGSKEPAVSIAARLSGSADPVAGGDAGGRRSLAARRQQITADSNDADVLGHVRLPERVTRSDTGSGRLNATREGSGTLVEQAPVETALDPDVEVRFAAEGHHPSETSTGLLAKLRRQPKPPDDHVHKFRASGSSVGLVRRVCTECAYVSIGSDNDD